MKKYLILFLLIPNVCFALAAFPGAEGFGYDTVGGRDATTTVYVVTNTNDSGAGSLRAACEASGYRMVVFKTGGTITLTSTIQIVNPNITIAGQTAPGGGITIKGGDFHIDTHDVVVRYLTFRRGSGGDNHCVNIWDHEDNDVYNIVIDHCSMSWATDENFGTQYRVYDLTVSYCISSEALKDSTHSKGEHSMAMMIGGTWWDNGESGKGAYDVSLHHNLMAHFVERGPMIDIAERAEVINNVIYNSDASMGMMYFRDSAYTQEVDWIKNYFKYGPDSGSAHEIRGFDRTGNLEFYVLGNIGPHRTSDSQAENLVVHSDTLTYEVGSRFGSSFASETSATQAYNNLLAAGGAGNSAYVNSMGTWVNRRDSIDERIVGEVAAGTGFVIDDPTDVGGWATISAGSAWTDTDSDGIPDDFENARYGDLTQTATGDYDSDGYNNIEEWFNGIPPDDPIPSSAVIGVSIQ